METHSFLPHTADIRMAVSADSLAGLFRAALAGMNATLKEGFCDNASGATVVLPVEVQSFDTTCLLVDFLSDVLVLTEEHHALFCRMDFHVLGDTSLHGTLHGIPLEGSFYEHIKAVTYHEAEVRKNADGVYETNIVFDI